MRNLRAFAAAFLAFSLSTVAVQAGGNAVGPVYPGAVETARPAGVGLKTPPPQAKTYATTDSFAKVQAWYRSQLDGAQELQQPGMEKIEDAFLLGSGQSATVVLIQQYDGKTWIVIGPPM